MFSTATRDLHRNNALHSACYMDHPECAMYLIDAGISIESRNGHGFTPLHVATNRGRFELAKALIDKGADFNATSDDGETPCEVYGMLVEGGRPDAMYSSRPENVKAVRELKKYYERVAGKTLPVDENNFSDTPPEKVSGYGLCAC
jgi:hypothetical protein